MPAPQEILKLAERFEAQSAAYQSGKYNEAQIRAEFIDPLFKALGWDIHNEQGYAEAYKDVIHEDAIKIGGATEAPDLCFRIGGTRKFFVECKKPSVNIKDDVHPAYQLRRYAWSARLPLSILTDFHEVAVYDCRAKPNKADSAAIGRLMYFTSSQFAEKWDEFAAIFSREAVLKGSFDTFAEGAKGRKGTAGVDDAFLEEIERWRDLLARNIAMRNEALSQRELNFSVQRIIDRIIFLRICEDRGIEPYGRLMTLRNGERAYPRLCEFFQRADERYNSGIFCFTKSKDAGGERPDELTLTLAIDDKVVKDIVGNLYYPESPYEFSVLPADILGQVYERFLGKVIRLTVGHQAKVEDKPEVRKAGGVYYTPTYIVDYIVKNTVGKLLADKTPRQAAKLRILDPACGSGSFLLGAYQYLLNWHRDYYVKEGPEKNRKVLYQAHEDWRLTTDEKKRILLNNIFGVDIDSQAVEVTKLSLLLKVLEGESQETITKQFELFHQRALPDLGRNIKCGNSLIGPDFYQNRQMDLFNEEDKYRVNAFDWKTEFLNIVQAGGFDTVIGNPPWGVSFAQPELEYLREHYARVIARMIDSYIYFIDRAFQVAKAEAPVGFIIPSTILNQVDAQPVRELILSRGLTGLINLGQGIFGSKVLNTSTIFVSGISQGHDMFLGNLTGSLQSDRSHELAKIEATSCVTWKQQVEKDPHHTFFTGRLDGTAILQRLQKNHSPLSRFISGAIQRGVSPDVVAAHVVSEDEAKALKLEVEVLRLSVSGSQIKRYRNWKADQFIIYTSHETQIKNYPRVLKHLEQFKNQNTCKEVEEGKHPWWCLHRPRNPQIFTSPKFVGLTTSKTIELVYDPDASVCATDAMYVFSTVSGVDPWAFMAMMQSKLFLFLYRVPNQGESRVIPQVKASKLDPLPFPVCDKPSPVLSRLNVLCRQMLALHCQQASAKTPQEQTALSRQIIVTDREIDKHVYNLYGLTEEETKIVEERT
ncbi:MAG: N-6 DNA methylase [Kiritimatiellae bacterium]|nr:N-6 DNA methylase [Kiritimatiellia bacterium]